MHTEINYAGDREKALVDAKEWLSKKQLKVLSDYAKSPERKFETFELFCDITGMRGFPVKVLWEELTA